MRPKRGKGRVWESRRQKRDRRRPKPFSAISLFGEFMDAKQSPTYVWKAMGLFSVARFWSKTVAAAGRWWVNRSTR